MDREAEASVPEHPHAEGAGRILERLGVTREEGLREDEVRERRERHGPNQLREARERGAWSILVEQFKSIVIIVLVAAMALALAFTQWPESIAIAAVIAVNTGIGFVSELRATRSMQALRQLGKHATRVRRDGEEREVPAPELVPGDVLVLRAEALVPADARVLETDHARVNEAALTGESVPVDKQRDAVSEDAPIAERVSMLYKGTTLVEGEIEAVVVATGMATELGRISEMAERAESGAPPLQKRLDRLGRRLALIVLGVTVIVAGAGLLAGRETMLMIETAIALGVAAIPEGLPIVATIALARGMWVMARRHALINRLPAVETLGATRVIFTDKTGTLTENRMTLGRVVTPRGEHEVRDDEAGAGGASDDPVARRILENGVLCSNAALGGEGDDEGERGDPMEVALLEAGREAGLLRPGLLEEMPEVREVSFDPDVMMMATYHRAGGDALRVAVKGAPQAVLERCASIVRAEGEGEGDALPHEALSDHAREEWGRRTEDLADEGLRVLAFAERHVQDEGYEPYEELTLLGLVGLLDPPRADVREAIDTCQEAGITVVMVTGDQAGTARAIAEAVGIVGDEDDPEARVMHGRDLRRLRDGDDEARERALRSNIFARVSPEQKLDLVSTYQEAGEIVAMTGDGVNDAPALKKADIGIAMGRRGTDAAKQTADMILTDDALSSIVAAVEQGRVIFANIRKSVMFMLCTNVAEVLAVAAASLTQLPLPLRPLQILYLNVLTDVFPALALAMTRGGAGVMRRPPRPADEPVLARRHWAAIGGWSALISATVLCALIVALRAVGLDDAAAITVSFLTLGLAKLWFVFNLRDPGTGLLSSPIVRNPWVWGSIGLCVLLLVAAVHLPGLSTFLETESPGLAGWGTALGFSVVPLVVGQAVLVGLRLRRGGGR